MIDYKLIKCPKCGKSHFKQLSYSSNGSTWFLDLGYGINDCVYRKPAERIYKNGVLVNPEDFTPDSSRTSFECLECGCHFSVKTTYSYVGGDIKYSESNEIIDDDKVEEEREAAYKKQQEEREKERKKKAAAEKRKKTIAKKKWEAEHPGEKYEDQFTTVKLSDNLISTGTVLQCTDGVIKATVCGTDIGEIQTAASVSDTIDEKIRLITTLGQGDKSEIDLGGLILKSDKVFTKREIKKIKKLLGFDVKNN